MFWISFLSHIHLLSLCSRALGPANTIGSCCSEDWRWVCSGKPHQSLEAKERNFILTRTFLEGWSSWALRNWCCFFPRHRVYYWGFFLVWRWASLFSPPFIPLFPIDSWHFIRGSNPDVHFPQFPVLSAHRMPSVPMPLFAAVILDSLLCLDRPSLTTSHRSVQVRSWGKANGSSDVGSI